MRLRPRWHVQELQERKARETAEVRAGDPLRFVYLDDDFAYARMVEHLLRTGQYRPDAWTAANLPKVVPRANFASSGVSCVSVQLCVAVDQAGGYAFVGNPDRCPSAFAR